MHLRFGAATAAALALLALVPAAPALAIGNVLDTQQGRPDLDARTGNVDPTSAQEQIVSSLGANVSWNQFGTPLSLIKYGGYLATGLSSDPVAAAKTFITDNKTLFRLSDQGVANLQLLNDSPMVGSDGHAVLFRQTFGSLSATQDGLITVGVTAGKVAYVSSSSAGDGAAPGAATLSAAAAWVAAANDVGSNVSIVDVHYAKNDATTGWTGLKVSGFDQYQRARLTAFPTYTEGVRPAYETIVIDTSGAWPTAYKEFVDAQTGKVWFRQNEVQALSDSAQAPRVVSGSTSTNAPASTIGCDPSGLNCAYTGTLKVAATVECGDFEGPFTAPTGTGSVDVVANTDLAANDIVLELYYGAPGGSPVATADTLTSPEAIHYAPAAAGTYYVRVCPFTHATADYEAPYTYHGTISMNPASGPSTTGNTPKWKVFEANPPLDYSNLDSRVIDCWLSSISSFTGANAECQRAVANIASRAPWDFDVQANSSTLTSKGNNANTAEAWGSPLTPGGSEQRPVAADRRYVDPWTNAWYTSKCDPGQLTPGGGNDILASVTNLFVGHNRMHDFAYYLGFTETNFNAQQSNFGNTAPGPYPSGREFDPEIGNVQAGAISGGAPSYLGRDNANQITLNDGISPVTNQYLFQPIAGSFYAPCVDGDLDTSVFAHEYTHLISNRMVAGPDSGLSGYQAGSMGESWSDLDAIEYLNSYGFVPTSGENPFAVGPYATGNKAVGIRDYALNADPLNYSDLGFDTAGAEVHADGEVWNGTNFEIRQGLINKYNASFPASNAALQKRCADGILPADQCPGNRRWIQIVYDAWLMMQSGVSMLDARDAYLAADMMRFGGANEKELWRAFAKRGMGNGASTAGTGDSDPKPSFASPKEANATITFKATAPDEGNAAVKAKIFVGKYEARVTAVADTDPLTPLASTASFVPGTYDFVAQAPGYGLMRFTQTFTNKAATVTVAMPTNWASSSKSATASGDGSTPGNLIDDTEGSQWESTAAPVAGKQVTVQLGGPHTIKRVQVSAMLQPGQNRFSALRQFEIWTCNGSCGAFPTGFTKVLTSPANAFPGVAPRPVSPDLIMRSFNIPTTTATHVRLVVVSSQCTGGPAFQGEQDNDPLNGTDCSAPAFPSSNANAGQVRAAELEVFSSNGSGSAGGGGCVLGYPSGTTGRPAVTFNESEVLRAFGVFGTGVSSHVALFYNDEHAMTLGVNPFVTPVTAMTMNPDHAMNPSVGDRTATDPSGRPEFPAAFVTNISNDPTSRAGDWQQQANNDNAVSPSDVFGTWKAATKSGANITPGPNPAKNNWNLGSGADPVPTTNGALPKNEGYGTEASWNFSDLKDETGAPLTSGNAYRVEFMVHDGDQTNTGGDSGEACVNIVVP
jgi:extracellular elastinolytic metalloproteinase